MAGRGRSVVQRLVQQHTAARAFSAVRTPQFASAVEASGLQGTAASANNSSARLWSTLGLGFAAAGLAVVPMQAACTPSVAAEAPPINLATAPLPPAKLDYQVVFVLGGPGSGKGTQCAKLVEEFGLVHLSAGDLLRAHMKSGTEDGNMVAAMIKQGQIVPSRVTISLLEAAMRDSGKRRFLIDGFPRNEENRSNFETQTGIQPAFVLFFDCPEEVMERRLLGRQEGRTDDNLETIRKRFKVFMDSTLPIINFYEAKGRVRSINADRSPDVVYADVRKLFAELNGM